jgi:trimethylguanosine synthase
VFASPPWGGPNYKSKSKYDLKTDLPLDFAKIVKIAISLSPNVIIYLPRNTDIGSIRNILDKLKLKDFIIEQYWMRNMCKAISLYIGTIFSIDDGQV